MSPKSFQVTPMADPLMMPRAGTAAPSATTALRAPTGVSGAAAALGAPTARFGRVINALELAGHSPAITRVRELVRRAATLDVGVLLTAERGADVDSVARELHGRSRRATAPYLVVECDGRDAPRLGQLLFGTGSPGSPGGPVAPTDLEPIARDSRVAAARGGTLFLQDVT